MTNVVPVFACPTDEWLPLDIHDPDGVQEVVRQVVDRGGWSNRRYAKAVTPHVRRVWNSLQEGRKGPAAVYVPHERPKELGRSLPSVSTAWRHPQKMGSTLAEVSENMSQPEPGRKRVVTKVELPAGPACRVYHETTFVIPDLNLTFHVTGVSHYLFPEKGPRKILAMLADWDTHTPLTGLVEMADQIAATLTLHPRTLERPDGWVIPAAKTIES
ncbi:hypothetical protein [Streptomyces litchfieldiae]|uniref:Uncharacterized protein n=1 Tax=Streptomyces litchfieldiae TaxID=3075543 RepID=A0ABU2MY27_9ACTN|nr:hypothetical protein [Streptomyces sp. DSM 44938]MDT0345944.1 hypothetical protein [Streptomyces sp. DSM 44938]